MPATSTAFAEITSAVTWEAAKAKLLQGVSTLRVAEQMQAAGDCLDVKRESLARQLNRWMEAEGKDLGAIAVLNPAWMRKVSDNYEQKVDELSIMEGLILYQKRRLDYLYEFEERSKLPNPDQSRELRALFDMCRELTELKYRLGIVKGGLSLPGTIEGTYRVLKEQGVDLEAALAAFGDDETETAEAEPIETEPVEVEVVGES